MALGAGQDLAIGHDGTDSQILNGTGNLLLGASATGAVTTLSGSSVKFEDGARGGSTWSAGGIALSSAATDWTNVEATFGTETSILGALYDLKVGIKAVHEITASAVNAGISVDLRTAGSDFSKANYTDSNIQIFKNGLLLLSGTHDEVNAGTAQYSLSGTDHPYRLGFTDQLLQGDVLVSIIS